MRGRRREVSVNEGSDLGSLGVCAAMDNRSRLSEARLAMFGLQNDEGVIHETN